MSTERKFLHDIASPMAILRLTLKQLEAECEKMRAAGKIDNPKVCQWIERMSGSIEKMEILHAEHKAHITSLEEEKKTA